MKITRQIILDLLPLYLANEVSKDTRDLIEKYLETDPQLAKIAKQSPTKDMLEDIPVPLSQDSDLEAYRRAKRSIAIRTIIIAATITAFLMLTLWMFFSSSSLHDRSCSAVERMASLQAQHELVPEVLEDRFEINQGLADSHKAEQAPKADNVCILILQQEDGCVGDNYMTWKTLAEGKNNA